MADEPETVRTYRDVWVEALDGLLAFADHLKVLTATRYPSTKPNTAERSTLLMGLRARRLLQGIRALVPHEWDDVCANLSRALVDTAIEIDYLHTSSTYPIKGGGERTLTPDIKAQLYETQRFIMAKKVGSTLAGEKLAAYEQATAVRKEHCVHVGNVWHGRTTADILTELQTMEDEDSQGRIENVTKAFRLMSFFEHNNGNPNFYVKRVSEKTAQVLETCTHSNTITSGVLAGAETCYTWGAVLGLERKDLYRHLEPVERAGKLDPMSFPRDN